MSITIPFTPAVEAKLRERAAAAGKDLDAFVREAVEEKLGLPSTSGKTPGQWTAEFDAWMREVGSRALDYPSGFVVDDSHESVYEDLGE